MDTIEERLTKLQWLGGQVPGSEDNATFNTLKGKVIDVEKYPCVFAWYNLVSRFTEAVRESWTGQSVRLDEETGLQKPEHGT